MTDDDVVETMTRAAHDANRGGFGRWDDLARASAEGSTFAAVVMEAQRNATRAAIRALHERGGLVVGKMPGDATCTEDAGDQEWAWVNGCNHGYAAVRAAAVKVEGV